MDKSDRTVIIFNIPTSFGGSDLRRCFTTFTETEKFECFHYKRRPEAKLPGFRRDLFLQEESENSPSDKNLAVAVLTKHEFVQPFIGKSYSLLTFFAQSRESNVPTLSSCALPTVITSFL